MEIDKLFGLPAHPLLVHVPVVLVPLAAVMAVAFAIRSSWLDRFGWVLVAVSGVGALGAVLAAGSGEALQDSVRRSSGLEDHAELGDTAKVIAVVFFVVVTAIVAFRWWSKKRSAGGGKDLARLGAAGILTAVLLVVSGGAAGFAIAKAGHQGAKVTWQEDAKKDAAANGSDAGSGGYDGDGDSDGG